MDEEDGKALLAIYRYRCLSESQILNFVYHNDGDERLKNLLANGLVESVKYQPANNVYFLTTLGVGCTEAIYSDVLQSLYGTERKTILKAGELKIKEQNINHQIHLNEFVLQFVTSFHGVIDYKYYDEKFMPKASDFMMPDGMLDLPNYFVLLEMDMGTETLQRLRQKWDSYRLFLNSPGSFYQGKPIVMFFILDGVKNIELRRRNIMSCILEYLSDRIDGQFEVYIDSAENLQEVIKSKLINTNNIKKINTINEAEFCVLLKSNYGFSIAVHPPALSKINAPFSFYMRKLNGDMHVIVEDGKAQEYLMDIWLDGRLSVCRNLMYFRRISEDVRKCTGRYLPYVVVVPSELWIAKVFQAMKLCEPKNIYFTTLERLEKINNIKSKKNYGWPDALFQIDRLGNLVHFNDGALRETVHERKILK